MNNAIREALLEAVLHVNGQQLEEIVIRVYPNAQALIEEGRELGVAEGREAAEEAFAENGRKQLRVLEEKLAAQEAETVAALKEGAKKSAADCEEQYKKGYKQAMLEMGTLAAKASKAGE